MTPTNRRLLLHHQHSGWEVKGADLIRKQKMGVKYILTGCVFILSDCSVLSARKDGESVNSRKSSERFDPAGELLPPPTRRRHLYLSETVCCPFSAINTTVFCPFYTKMVHFAPFFPSISSFSFVCASVSIVSRPPTRTPTWWTLGDGTKKKKNTPRLQFSEAESNLA